MQVFPPIHLHHSVGRGVGFEFVTEFYEVLGLLTGCDSSYYHDDARGLHHPKQFVNVDVAAFACPFPSALACALFFHDASGPLHYPSVKMKQKWNDHVYVSCVLLGPAPVTYKELVEYSVLGENREYAQIPCGSPRRRRPDTESTTDTLLSAPGKNHEDSDRRTQRATCRSNKSPPPSSRMSLLYMFSC